MELLGNINKDYTVNVLKWGYLNKKFSESFILSVQQDIGSLLKEKIKKYCKGLSTSVTVEVGEQLLEAIYYTIDANFANNFNMEEAIDLFKRNSIGDLYKEGEAKLKDLFENIKELYKRVCENKYNTELIAYNDTLDEFGKSFDTYDIEFNPQDIDASVDYPLIFGDLDKRGIYYVKDYLEVIDIENRFCNIFDNEEVETLLDINAKRYQLNYRDLLTNVFEIVINNTILSIIVDDDFEDFYIYREEINYLKNNLNIENVEQKVNESVEKMISLLNIKDSELLKYVNLYKYRFVDQLKLAINQNNLESMAVICDEYLEISKDLNKNKFIIDQNILSDEELRKILEEIEEESDLNKKVEIIKTKINSFEDFNDILKADCFYGEEYNLLFDSLDEVELCLLVRVMFYEEIEMGKFNLLKEIFKDATYDYTWQECYVEYMKNQTIDRISRIQNKALGM